MVEHPYANPATAVSMRLPGPDEPIVPPPGGQSWAGRGMTKFKARWVDLPGSIQWQSFLRAVERLQARGNRVFVLVGPFNEHMLSEASRRVYQDRKNEVDAWLRKINVPHLIGPAAAQRDLCRRQSSAGGRL